MWKETYNKESTDGTSHSVHSDLHIEFEPSTWNKSSDSPIIRLQWHDKKNVTSWPVCKLPTISMVRLFCTEGKFCSCPVHVSKRRRRFSAQFLYFQRIPQLTMYSADDESNYESFTVAHCQNMALTYMREHLKKVSLQLSNL